ncbi:MAG TPA: glycoside hydrolase family 140 protein [Saprospiraceae bacterium]|nr:glycoside hydrolase family 140 protein [Saprospiraceae bacterium]
MIRLFCLFLISILLGNMTFAQRLAVHDSDRFLMREDGQPFFWLADTAWELFHRCDREAASMYLEKRASQGFNVIQAVALAELDGLNTPNPYGERPLMDNDPNRPNERYFEHVDFIINKADELGLYIALLPTWGDKVNRKSWGVGPEVFNVENAAVFGRWMGERYKDYDNIIWIIGGDRNPNPDSNEVEIWNAMAEAIAAATGGYEECLMSFHPQPKEAGGSSTWFHQEKWLDFNMHQTGHCANQGTYKHISHDYTLQPIKPVLDGEPLYEDHPNCFNARELGHSIPRDIRRIMYWNVFAGAFGQSYGCHDVWQMYTLDKEPINQPLRPWPEALDLPMANQVRHLKELMLSRPFFTRIPDQSLIVGKQPDDQTYKIATRDQGGTYAMVYLPVGGTANLNVSAMAQKRLSAWWFDPRTGSAFSAGKLKKGNQVTITAPSSGPGNDWVLVLDAKSYPTPGHSDQ